MAPSSKKESMGSPKKKLKDMNIEEFMTADFDSGSESSSISGSKNGSMANESVSGKKRKNKRKTDSISTMQSKKKQTKEKKVSLAETLKDADPDFYEYLQGEDQSLLNTLEDLSESGSGSDSESKARARTIVGSKKRTPKHEFEKDLLDMSSGDDSDNENSESSLHRPPQELEVASDDSELDNDEVQERQTVQGDMIMVTQTMIEEWTKRFISAPSIKLLKISIAAFNGAVSEAAGTSEGSHYKIKGDSVFNAVVRMCLAHIPSALEKILHVPSLSSWKQTLTSKNKNWIKAKLIIKSYLSDTLKLLSLLSDPTMINTILKHVHKLTILYISFGKLARHLLKQMIRMWSSGEETTRIIAFLIINKVVLLQKDVYLETAIKKMYMAYVSNCKFVSPNTLPLINFMQRSLVEIFNQEDSMSYQYAFVYIRQLAIHLRNAMTVTKKNTCQTVYNWQYIHCLGLWVQLISSFPTEALKPLIYPLTQTIIGTIKLLPSPRFYPLRFHCVKFLNMLSMKTKTYIPTLPFLLEVFDQTDFNKRHKSVSSKPFNFAVILKFTKQQLLEKSFKDGLVDQLFEHLMESYNVHAHSVGFPELIIPSLLRLKDFIKKCKIANYCKQVKQIIEKIEEQSNFIVQRRKQSTMQLDDFQALHLWEQEIETSPFRSYYTSWRKLRDREIIHGIANKEVVSGAAFDMPAINRKTVKTATPEERKDFQELFEDMSDSDDDTRFLLKEERPGKENKKRKRSDDDSDGEDDYSDFDDEELEQLAKSASEDEQSGDEDSGPEESDVEESGSESESAKDSSDESEGQNEKRGKNGSSKTSTLSSYSNEGDVDKNDDSDDVVEDFVMSDSDDE